MKHSFLVVGGAGYIGSHMCRMLLQHGHKVTVFDNLSRGHRDAVRQTHLIEGDLRSREDLARAFASDSFDVVLHFAALAYVGESVLKPALYYDNNVRGTLNLVDAMLARGARCLVFSSTCATYGEPLVHPIPESHPQNPVNPYGRTKLVIEGALRDFAGATDLRSISLRYFNAAGCDPGGELGERHEPETHLIPLVLAEALRVIRGGDPTQTKLEVFGDDFDTPDGTCIRDYVHVNDLCSAHLLAAQRLMAGDVKEAEAYNLSNGAGYSVKQVIDACRRLTGVDLRYRIAPKRTGDPGWLVGESSRARDVLGWRPAIRDLQAIVRTSWNWQAARNAEVPVRVHKP